MATQKFESRSIDSPSLARVHRSSFDAALLPAMKSKINLKGDRFLKTPKPSKYIKVRNSKQNRHTFDRLNNLEDYDEQDDQNFSDSISQLCSEEKRKIQRKIRRIHLDEEQQVVLENEFQMRPNWSTAFITTLARRLKLPRTKVYKWNWDRKKKELSGAQIMPELP